MTNEKILLEYELVRFGQWIDPEMAWIHDKKLFQLFEKLGYDKVESYDLHIAKIISSYGYSFSYLFLPYGFTIYKDKSDSFPDFIFSSKNEIIYLYHRDDLGLMMHKDAVRSTDCIDVFLPVVDQKFEFYFKLITFMLRAMTVRMI
jgi:hypothetical protein